MSQYILEYSKYTIALLGILYCLLGGVILVFDKRVRWAQNLQTLLFFLTHTTCFLSLLIRTENMQIVFFYLFQLVALYTTLALYYFLYPNANKLLVNNMCMLMALGFVILTRLNYNKAMKQFIIVVISLALSLVVPELITRFKQLKDWTWYYGIVGIFSLGIVLVLGAVTKGAKLSFTIAGLTFQPSEFIKILFVLFIAGLLSQATDLKQVFLSAVMAAGHVLVLVASKDLGSALIYFVAYVVMVFAATANVFYLGLGFGGGAVAAYLAYRLFSHVRVRFKAWKDPWSVIDGAGYQITQSLFAIGCGGLFGLGLCKGSPKSIPYVDTDFVFSAIAEEMGTIFAICLILIYISCFLAIVKIAVYMTDPFYRLTALGLGTTYIVQVFLTIGGVIKFIPMTGVTLPFISYGGSSVLATILTFSVIQGLYLIQQRESALREEFIARRREERRGR